jgi:MOSC domain-containing protein YiiM
VRTLRSLFSTLPQVGRVEWIGVRPEHRAPVVSEPAVEAIVATGLRGDRYASSGRRQVTLIQAEHLAAVASLLGSQAIKAEALRRNIVVSGINLLALKGARFRVGEALLEGTGPCEPCSRMEDALGPGGYNAMRGHGGITARVIEGGWIRIGDSVTFVSLENERRQTDLFST